MPKQKMSDKDLDGIVEKLSTLVANQSEWATKLSQNEFINELSYDYNCVGPQRLYLHPLCCIINNNQNVFVYV